MGKMLEMNSWKLNINNFLSISTKWWYWMDLDDLFTARSNLLLGVVVWEIAITHFEDFGLSRQLNDYLKISESRSTSFFGFWQWLLIFQRRHTSPPNEAKLTESKCHMKPSWVRETIVCLNGSGHMTTMSIMPMYGKNLKQLLITGTWWNGYTVNSRYLDFGYLE